MLSISQRPCNRKRKDCIRTALKRHLNTLFDREDSHFSTLGEACGHDDHYEISSSLPRLLEMMQMTVVKRIIFCNDTCDLRKMCF